jgi:hypothetical protein
MYLFNDYFSKTKYKQQFTKLYRRKNTDRYLKIVVCLKCFCQKKKILKTKY